MYHQYDNQPTRQSCQCTANTFPHLSQRAIKNGVGLATRWSSILALCLLWFTAMPVAAATIVVNSNADTTGTASICTLRDAITAANTNTVQGGCAAGNKNAIADTIIFAPNLSGQTITLTSALPQLTSNLTIDGTSLASHVRISGNNTYQVFRSARTVILTHLDIINGVATSGGGIEGHGRLTVNNSTFSGNSASSGGGIWVSGTLTVNNSTFSGNSASQSGGGISFGNYGRLTVNNSTFSGNSASSCGGIASWSSIGWGGTRLSTTVPFRAIRPLWPRPGEEEEASAIHGLVLRVPC